MAAPDLRRQVRILTSIKAAAMNQKYRKMRLIWDDGLVAG
jgi:hypothetical protein